MARKFPLILVAVVVVILVATRRAFGVAPARSYDSRFEDQDEDFREADADGSGFVTFDEFWLWHTNRHAQQRPPGQQHRPIVTTRARLRLAPTIGISEMTSAFRPRQSRPLYPTPCTRNSQTARRLSSPNHAHAHARGHPADAACDSDRHPARQPPYDRHP